MAENKTKETNLSVDDFINSVEDENRRKDCLAVIQLMKKITQEEPKMWGTGMIGFGNYRYRYESGREGEFFLTGFSPRKNNLTLYIHAGFDRYDDLMKKLGKVKCGKSCLYVNRLSDLNEEVLKELIHSSVDFMQKKYPS